MTVDESDLRGDVYRLFKSYTALADEIADLGGSDKAFLRIQSDPRLRFQIAALLVPNHPYVEPRTVTVNYDDPRWDNIDPSRYHSVEGVVRTDFPIGDEVGNREISYHLILISYSSSDRYVLSKMKGMGCRQPSRAEAETIIESFTPEELKKHPIVGIIGPPVERAAGHEDREYRLCIRGNEDGLDLCWNFAGDTWRSNCLFIAVCEP
ncbi:hypothetical protein KKG41_02740 [Patescibacteria group bacterium]|nr:hypothetical protein [Patescibacteria group bacterium]MBU1890053.1 hypothetical protein [Patescibacteria group bacterium]